MKKRLCLFLLCLSACTQNPLTQITAPHPAFIPRFEAFQLIVHAPSQRQYTLLEQQFKARIKDRLEVGQDFWLLLEFSEPPVQYFSDLLRAWHRTELLPLKNYLPAQHWQTLLLSEELFQAGILQPEQVLLNLESQPAGIPEPNDLQSPDGKADAGWWRRETGVERAWQYSIGTDIRVAWIDLGFIRQHPEIERRLQMNGRNNQTLEWGKSEPHAIDKPPGDHGLTALLVGFAERNNRIPSVGVAPNAQVIPYVASNVWEVARALQVAAEAQPHVIGMNFAFPVYPHWENLTAYTQYHPLKAVIARLEHIAPGVPLVLPAHNYAEPIRGGPRTWFPISLVETDPQYPLIGVGGIERKEGKALSAWFNPNLLTAFNARGSNYSEALVWAPATPIDIANSDPSLPWPQYMHGTSASAPFVAGALALLRACCPQLIPVQMRELLRQTGRAVDASQLFARPGVTVPLIQIDRALEHCLSAQGFSPAQMRAREFRGVLRVNAQGAKFLETEQGFLALKPTLPDLEANAPHLLLDRPVRVWGWQKPPHWTGQELDVLALQADES